MCFKKIIFAFSFFSFIFCLIAVTGTVNAQMNAEELSEKLSQISTEGKTKVEILNEIIQQGELDETVPKRTIKTEDGAFLKHYLGLSDNVTYLSEQLQPSDVSTKHYRVIFKPSVIMPDIDPE